MSRKWDLYFERRRRNGNENHSITRNNKIQTTIPTAYFTLCRKQTSIIMQTSENEIRIIYIYNTKSNVSKGNLSPFFYLIKLMINISYAKCYYLQTNSCVNKLNAF